MTNQNETGSSLDASGKGVTAHASSPDLSYKPSGKDITSVNEERDMVLNHQDAQAGSPDDIAACGEEDIGSGLEFLVTRQASDDEDHQ